MEKRVALVVGNRAYKHTPWLQNAVKDADAVGHALKRLGFNVLDGRDLDFASLARQVRDFGRALRDAHVALFYYAGHGLQVRGENYVVPIDASLEHEADVQLELVAVQTVLAQMELGNRTSIVILDACRDNPLARNLARAMGGTRSVAIGKGLGPIQSGVGTYIAFATAHGQVASDGGGADHSPFTASLLDHIEEPELSISDIMMRVRQKVIAMTQDSRTGVQVPWESSALVAPFYFKPKTNETVALLARPNPAELASDAENDWERLKIAETENTSVIKKFIEQYDNSEHLWAVRARQRLEVVEVLLTERARIKLAAPFCTNPYGNWFLPGAGKTEWFKDLDIGPELVVIPAGKFIMGSPEDEPQRLDNEGMQHEVLIPKHLAVGRCTVTRGQFAAFVDATGYEVEGGAWVFTGNDWKLDLSKSWRDPGFEQDDSHPVVCVSWDDAQAYIAWLSKLSSLTYRLLSEAEWEYACRAGTSTPYWWGSAITPDQANYDSAAEPYSGGGKKAEPRRGTVPAKGFEPNAWGLYQVHGNVWEWCEDLWHDNYADKPDGLRATGSAWTAGSSDYRVLRGGSWGYDSQDLRSAHRDDSDPRFHNTNIGFRVARQLKL
jgi:formylglycine-generating enzyme required for sulfatase activity